MNTDSLIEKIHASASARRQAERQPAARPVGASPRRKAFLRLASPALAAAAVALLLLWPRGSKPDSTATVYCNSDCAPADVLSLIANNISHIQQIQQS